MARPETVRHEEFGYTYIEGSPTPIPLDPPPFTLKEIRDAIPKHCFERSLLKSVGYLFLNLFICAALFYFSSYFTSCHLCVQFFVWPTYWGFQAINLGGIWVIGHECGHVAFSDYPLINDTVGYILHSSLLVPYQNWKISHHKHHLNSASCENDEVFVPPTRSAVSSKSVDFLEESPIYETVVTLLFFLSWIPGYLVYNFSGPLKYRADPKIRKSHFSPENPIYAKKQKGQLILGNIGFLISLFALIWFSMTHGFVQLYLMYGLPYCSVNFGLIFVTYMHHTDIYIPHYRGKEWTWLKGALCTVDRSFGTWTDAALHHISDTHVVHHLFPTLPFYHAVEATEAITKLLGPYYLRDNTSIVKSFRRLMANCRFVEDEGDIVFYKKSLK